MQRRGCSSHRSLDPVPAQKPLPHYETDDAEDSCQQLFPHGQADDAILILPPPPERSAEPGEGHHDDGTQGNPLWEGGQLPEDLIETREGVDVGRRVFVSDVRPYLDQGLR
jgi:hypothetical protein